MHNFFTDGPVDNPNFLGKLSTGFVNETNNQTWLYGTGWVLPEEFDNPDDMTFEERAKHARRECRSAFMTPNAIFEAGVNVKLAYVVGDEARVGHLYDKEADEQLQLFIAENDFNDLISDRIATEMLIDGELHAVIDKDFDPATEDVPLIGLANAENVNVRGNRIRGIKEISIPKIDGEPDVYTKTQFTSWAHKANFGELRGYPPFEGARQLAGSMVEFINGRLRINAIQSRLNMVQKHLIWPKSERNKLTISEQKDACMGQMMSIPDDGGVIHIFMDGDTGFSEETVFLKTDKAATDASSDYEILRRQFASGMGLADHQLGWGDSTNRATAETISETIIKSQAYFQSAIRKFITGICRNVLFLLNGEDHLYTIEITDPDNEENTIEKQVKVNMLPIPVELPELKTDSLEEEIKFYDFANRMGYDSQKVLTALGLKNDTRN